MHARFNRILLCFMGRRDKSWQRLQAEDERRSRGGQNLFSCPSKRSSPLHFSLRCIIYTISSNNAAGLLSIIDRIKTAYPGISWSINEATLRDRERTKLILHRSVESNGRNRKVSANCWKNRSVRFETRAQTTRVQQHNTVSFGNAMRFDATRAPTPPTDSPSACTLTLTLPTSLHREPLSLLSRYYTLLSSRDPRSTLLHGVPRFPPSHSHSTRTLLRYFALRALCPFPTHRLHPCSVFPPPLIRLSFAFLPLFLSLVSFPIRLGSSFPPSGISLLFFPFFLHSGVGTSDNSFLSHRLDLRLSVRKDDSSFDLDTYRRKKYLAYLRSFTIGVNCVAIESCWFTFALG